MYLLPCSTNNHKIVNSYSNFIINIKIILRDQIIFKSVSIYFKCRKEGRKGEGRGVRKGGRENSFAWN